MSEMSEGEDLSATFSILYPERRTVSGATLLGWAQDAVGEREVEPDGFDGSLESAIYLLEDEGLVTFAHDDPEDPDYEGDEEVTDVTMEVWARSYDELNGAPEGEWDR